jgi:hypothetical protein
LSLVRIDWRPGPKKLREFGAAILIGFAIIGGILYWRDAQTAAYVCWIVAAAIGPIGLTGARIALPFYWVWMGFAFVMGNIMTRVVLAVVYYGVITPIGIAQRLAGRDRLQLHARTAETYWHDLPEAPPTEHYERQF